MKYLIKIICVLIIFTACQKNERLYDIIITNGNVIDITSGSISKQNIYVLNGRIAKIEPAATKVEFRANQVLDATDKYILPGFWDNHVHFRGGDSLIQANKDLLKLFIMNGITTVRDAGGDLGVSVLEWKKQIENVALIGPTIFTAGPKIDGPNATWAGSLVVDKEADITVALDSLQRLNVDFVKLYDSRIKGELYLRTVAEASKRGLITSGHMPFTVMLEDNLNAGIGAIEHLYFVLKGCSSEEKRITDAIRNKDFGFWQSMEKLIATYQDSTAQNTFTALKNKNVYVLPTLHIGDVLSHLDEVDHSNDEYLKLMEEGIVKTYEGRINRALNSSEEAKADRKVLNSFFKNLVKSLSDAEVKLLAGSDSGAFNSYTYPGISLHKELEAMVSTGMTPLEALQTSAYNGAGFLKKNSDYGTIEVNKISDLVLLNENPLEDIKSTRRIDKVIKGGQVIEPELIAQEFDCLDCIKK